MRMKCNVCVCLLILTGCSQASTYLVDASGDAILVQGQPAPVIGYFACGSPSLRSCETQAAEICRSRFGLPLDRIGPVDVAIDIQPEGFNYFPIQPNTKVHCGS